MSWVIKASPNVIRTEEDEPEPLKVGDRVRVLPWEGIEDAIPYDYVLGAGGPEGIVARIGTSGRNAYIQFERDTWWIYLKNLERI